MFVLLPLWRNKVYISARFELFRTHGATTDSHRNQNRNRKKKSGAAVAVVGFPDGDRKSYDDDEDEDLFRRAR